jgi:hypothetical protein
MKKKEVVANIELRCDENMKQTGGGENYAWNERLQLKILSAIPIGNEDFGKVGTAVFSGIIDIKPADPIEGMLVSQLIVANEAALSMFSRAWRQDNFDFRMKYLAQADRAQRTVIMLTERLDHHRGRGRQEISVRHQHVTVNADQAIVGNVTAGGGSEPQLKDQPHAITYAPGITVPSRDQKGEPVPVASDEKRSLPDARRTIPGRAKGK